eukprot:6028140-Pyramimonas_sp.AAC.1
MSQMQRIQVQAPGIVHGTLYSDCGNHLGSFDRALKLLCAYHGRVLPRAHCCGRRSQSLAAASFISRRLEWREFR